MTAITSTFESFKFLREQHIPSLNITVQEFEHKSTGAQHIHMQADSDENVFLVALRTVPHDSTGVAHMLEHTALCGSKKYPVRDPFFMMTRRSLNTFMNAFTSSDWTAYPVASLNKKDFNNLLDVYLDAVFFSRLDELDFAQEGHRLEFEDMEDSTSNLLFKGVVYNEMKGAMSSVNSQLWQTFCKYLFPTSTYHFNSGGEPEDIPNLSYAELKAFYQTHYHPSNAIFMTYGDIPACAHQEKFENQVLSQFERSPLTISVKDEKRYFAPLNVQEYYPNDEADLSNKTHVVVGWLLGQSANLEDTLRAQLLTSVLLDNSASPLMLALESSDLGDAPSPLCGLDDSQKELSFIGGLAGTNEDSTEAVEALIIDTLNKVVHDGVPQEDIEAALHQLELQQREVGGDSYPYGLQLILKSLTGANHRGDAIAQLDLDAALSQLRKDIVNPNFLPELIQSWLLDNPHRVRLTLSPDGSISKKKEDAEALRLSKIKAALSDEEKQNIIKQSLALQERQEAIDDPSILPQVTLADVPDKERSISPTVFTADKLTISRYETGTNGLIYQQVIYPQPNFTETELAHCSLYNNCLSELGAGSFNYLEMQKHQSSMCGGIASYNSLRGGVSNANDTSAYYVFSGKALKEKHTELSELMRTILSEARFDEVSRMREIVGQTRVAMEQSITGSGHMFAMSAAAANISTPAQISHKFSGLNAIQTIRDLDKQVGTEDGLAEFASVLEGLHNKITKQKHQLLIIGEPGPISDTVWSPLQNTQSAEEAFTYNLVASGNINQAWIANSQVNFCAQAFPTVSTGHEDSAALVILGAFLRNGILHKSIREQGGAYGGGASQDNNSACFRFYSYRDPRMGDTLDDFKHSIEWLTSSKHDNDKIEEAILGTISSIDRSESPAGQAKRCFHSELHERTLDVREKYRQKILSTTLDDLVRVADTYLNSENANTAVVTGKHGVDEARKLGLEIIELG